MMVQNFNRAQHHMSITVGILALLAEINLCKPILWMKVCQEHPWIYHSCKYIHQIRSAYIYVKCLSNILILDCGFNFSSNVKVLHKQSKRRHIYGVIQLPNSKPIARGDPVFKRLSLISRIWLKRKYIFFNSVDITCQHSGMLWSISTILFSDFLVKLDGKWKYDFEFCENKHPSMLWSVSTSF